jgi:hypothetical protein
LLDGCAMVSQTLPQFVVKVFRLEVDEPILAGLSRMSRQILPGTTRCDLSGNSLLREHSTATLQGHLLPFQPVFLIATLVLAHMEALADLTTPTHFNHFALLPKEHT